MINLLPPETKRQIRAGRINVVLYRYCLLVIGTALVLGGVFGLGFWADMNDRTLAEATKTQNQAAAKPYEKTRAAAEDYAKNLVVAKTILGSNVSFSTLIFGIAAAIPQGVVLNTLSLSATTKADAPIDITGRAASYERAVSLKNSLEASPIFEKVSIVNINQAEPNAQTTDIARKYPFTVSIKAQFSKGQSPQGAK